MLVAAPCPRRPAQQRRVVVIDPGHDLRANPQTEPIGPGSSTRKIKDGGGTHGVVSGLREADLNLRVALRLRALLERAGVKVVMTRTRTAGTSIGNIARARIANRAGAALFLRIHADGSTDPAARGTHTLYPALRTGLDGRRLRGEQACGADRPGGAPLRALGFPDRGLQERSDFTGFNWADVPGDPRRDGLHDEPDRGSAARDRRVPAPRGGRPLPRDASLPRSLARGLRLGARYFSASRPRRPRPAARRP